MVMTTVGAQVGTTPPTLFDLRFLPSEPSVPPVPQAKPVLLLYTALFDRFSVLPRSGCTAMLLATSALFSTDRLLLPIEWTAMLLFDSTPPVMKTLLVPSEITPLVPKPKTLTLSMTTDVAFRTRMPLMPSVVPTPAIVIGLVMVTPP